MTGRLELGAVEALVEALRPLVAELVAEELERRLDELELRDPGPRWLTLEQAAGRLGCSPTPGECAHDAAGLGTAYQGRRMYVLAEAVDRL